MTNAELLDALTERVGKMRDQVIADLKVLPCQSYGSINHNNLPQYYGSLNHNYLLGYDRGLYLALLAIADMKREQDKNLDSDLDSDPGT